jgi:hypothetical protein
MRMKCDTGSLHIIPLRIWEFHENRSEIHTLLKGVDEIFPILYGSQVWVKFGTAYVQNLYEYWANVDFEKSVRWKPYFT